MRSTSSLTSSAFLGLTRVRTVFLVICSSFLLCAPAFGVVTFELVDCSRSGPTDEPGNEITFGFRIIGEAVEGIVGLSASAYGYDPALVEFEGGTGSAVRSIFHDVATPGGTASGGLSNLVFNPLVEQFDFTGAHVPFFLGLALRAYDGNPLDPGLDGVVGGGDAQVRMTFRVLAAGPKVIRIGTGHPFDDAIYFDGSSRATIDLVLSDAEIASMCPVPEPTTALLLAAGVCGLAVAPRPRRRSSFATRKD